MVARAGILVLIAVDTAMTGHTGTEELAANAVASAPLVPMLLLGVGLLSGTTVFIAHAVASGSTLVSQGTVVRPNCSLPHCSASLSPAVYLRFDSAWFREPWSALRRDKIPNFDFFTTRHKARV